MCSHNRLLRLRTKNSNIASFPICCEMKVKVIKKHLQSELLKTSEPVKEVEESVAEEDPDVC